MSKTEKNGKYERAENGKKTFFRLISYLRDHKMLLAIISIMVTVSVISSLAGSYMIRPITNDYIIPGDLTGLGIILLILLGIYIVGTASTYIHYRLVVKIGMNTATKLRTELFSKMERLPVRYFDTHQYGNLMSRYTNDMDRISEVLTDNLSDIISSLLILFGIICMMIYISPLLTVVTLIIVPMMALTVNLIAKKSRKYFKAQQNSIGLVNGYIEEIISGQKVIKLFGHEKTVESEFEKLNRELNDKSKNAQLYSGMIMPVIQNLNTLSFVTIAIVGALLAVYKGLDIGGLAVFLQYSRQFGRPINDLATIYNNIQAAIAGAERVFQLMDELPEPPDQSQARMLRSVKGDICMNHVYFSYEKDKPVLKDICLHIEPGKKVALIGKTGAGKTTVFNLLPRFYDIWEGEIAIDGNPIMEIRRDDLRNLLAIVLQDTHIFTGTVYENIRFGNFEATEEDIIKAAKLTSAHSFIKRLPHGYDTMLENDGENLSQGQRQLLNIARAAVSNPSILLLDEATSNIDTRSEILIQKGLDKLMEGRTCLIIAHRLSTIRNADMILVLDSGKIVECGNHTELTEKRGHYYHLCQNQFNQATSLL